MKKYNQLLKKRHLELKGDSNFNKLKLNRDIGLLIIQNLFDMYDENLNRNLDQFELKKVLNGLGCYLKEEEIIDIMKEIDKDGSGNIDIQEFIQVFGKTHLNSNYFIEQYIERAFDLYDKDGDGFISEKDFINSSSELNEDLEEEDMTNFFDIVKALAERKKISNQKDGLISKEEFVNFLFEIGFIDEDEDLRKK